MGLALAMIGSSCVLIVVMLWFVLHELSKIRVLLSMEHKDRTGEWPRFR